MTHLASDVKHALRMFRQNPAFTITAIAALALGIGVTTAIFSLVNTVLLKPIPVPDADRFVALGVDGVKNPETGSRGFDWSASPAKFVHWRAQSSLFEDISLILPRLMNYTAPGTAEQWRIMQVSAGSFRCWGMQMLLGRAFSSAEELPNSPLVAVISESLWSHRYARDPKILGKAIMLSGDSYTVIGVVANSAALDEFSPSPVAYVPFPLDPNTRDQGVYFAAVAHLRRGVTLAQANARLRTSTGEYRSKFPKDLAPQESFGVETFRQANIGDIRPLLLILSGAVALVLLIACLNVANLLLARLTSRKHEIAIRAALGARSSNMIRQLLAESLMLSLAGCALGVWLGYAGIRTLLAVNTADLPFIGEHGDAIAMDWRVLTFSLLISLATAVAFGLLPALQAARADISAMLQDSSGRSTTGLHHNKSLAVLVVSEVSLAVLLLVGSALLIRTFQALYRVERGFNTTNLITLRTSLDVRKYSKSNAIAGTIRGALEQIRSLPGVTAATASCCLPLEDGTYDENFEIVGRQRPDHREVGWATVSPGYFEVFKIPLKRGRTFTERDAGGSAPVVIINESMAKRYWRDRDPLQDRVQISKDSVYLKDEPARQIIGIVGDVRDESLKAAPRPIMYIPQAQLPDTANALFGRLTPLAWVVRTETDPRALLPAVRKRLQQATGWPVSEGRLMDEVVSTSLRRQRFNMLLMTVFASAALLLAAIGIFGLMAYTVEQRTQEIGIRMALGAGAGQVRSMIVTQGMRLALAGLVIGLGAAWGLSRFLRSLLFGVKPSDPFVFVAAAAVLAAVALFSVWLPAARASRLNPVESLRHQ
jgi:putative ABC transport system permease protein